MVLPTGRQLAAARALAMLEQRKVAKRAKINVTTLYRMEACGAAKVRGIGTKIEAVLNVLREAGVELTYDPDGVRLIAQPKQRRNRADD